MGNIDTPGLHTGVSDSNDDGVGTSVHQALRFLSRNGYIAYTDLNEEGTAGMRCETGAGSKAGIRTDGDTQKYACVWGTLMNIMELDGLKNTY